MATERQKRALKNMVENGGNVSKAMRDAGYSKNTAVTPKKLTESAGFQEMCDELGLTDTLLIDALVEDIQKKKGNRKAELELGFKVRGRLRESIDPGKLIALVLPGEIVTKNAIPSSPESDSERPPQV